MKTIKTLSILLIPMLMLTGIAPIGIANASKPTGVSFSGEWEQTGFDTIIEANGNLIVKGWAAAGEFTGELSGPWTGVWILPWQNPASNSKFEFQGTITCECTYQGKTGTVVLMTAGKGAGLSFTTHWVIISSTGDLANLHGIGMGLADILGDTDGDGLNEFQADYSGQVHFDP